MLNLIKHARSHHSQLQRGCFSGTQCNSKEKAMDSYCCSRLNTAKGLAATLFCCPTATQESSMHSYPLPLSLKGI